MTLLCVPIMVQDEQSVIADAASARKAGADIIELRVDHVFSGANINEDAALILRIIAASPLPCIVTCRTVAEGGHYDGDEMSRVSFFERLGTAVPSGEYEHPPRYIDFELGAYTKSANIRQKINLAVDHSGQHRGLHTSLILSSHDFQQRPPDLLRRIARIRDAPGAAVAKIAFTARSIRDNLELFDLLAENAAGKPMIALAMGRFGLMSRVLAPKFGGFLTFASLREESATAPGQPTIRELLGLYRFRSITPRTVVYGAIGWPLDHTLSPLVHNAGFAAAGRDAVYLPLPIPPEYEHFKASLGALVDHPRLDFSGCSVTIPHKENLLRFAFEEQKRGAAQWDIAPLALACGAANTLSLKRDRSGDLASAMVLNTDAPAISACLTAQIGDLAGKRIAVIGAGGVARSAACALLIAGAGVTIFNRTSGRTQRLIADLRAGLDQHLPGGRTGSLDAAPLEELATSDFDIYINCTPVGMTGGLAPESSPLPPHLLQRGPDIIVMDTVYTPLRTPLLTAAEAAGCRTIDGLMMFIRQAQAQFAAWTGSPPPHGLFESVARDAAIGHSSP